MVATQFRDVHVSVFIGACDEAEGVEEALFDTFAEEQYVLLRRIA